MLFNKKINKKIFWNTSSTMINNTEIANAYKNFKVVYDAFISALAIEVIKLEKKLVLQNNPIPLRANHLSVIDQFKAKLDNLINAYKELQDASVLLMYKKINNETVNEMNGLIKKIVDETTIINTLINDHLFKTKSERFLLALKDFVLKINNFITRKGYAPHVVVDGTIILTDGQKSYTPPTHTLYGNRSTRQFVSKQLSQTLERESAAIRSPATARMG